MKQKITALFLSMAVLAPQFLAVPVMAEDEIYAEIVFGKGGKSSNISIAHNFVQETAADKEGLRSKKASRAEFINFNINDSVLYNIPDGTPIDIEVEYFDDIKGSIISLTYDAHRPPKKFDVIVNNTIYKTDVDDTIYLEGSGEWKTHTFHIEDLKAANRMNWADFRLGVWAPETGMSPNDILIRSVKVKKSEYESAVVVDKVYFDSLGHKYTKGDKLELKADVRNMFDETVTFTGNAEIFDRYGKKYSDNQFSMEIGPKEEKTVSISLQNPEWNDLYDVKVTTENFATSNPDKKYSNFFETDFSISILLDRESADPGFGSGIQINKGYGEPQKIAETHNSLGSSYIRDDVFGGNVKWNGSSYTVNQDAIDDWTIMRENGINVVGNLTAAGPLNSWNKPPVTEKELAQHELFCEQVAAQLKGVVDIFNAWNEYDHQYFNILHTGAEDYTNLLKATYRGVKKGNPDAIVLGPELAGVNHAFVETMCQLGALDYMDGLSLHPYQWTGSFDPQIFIDGAMKMKEIMRKYGDEKPMWITEFGFSSCGGSHFTVEEQYRLHTLARAVNKSFGLYDKYIQYCLADYDNRTLLEHNWGFINWWDEQEGLVSYGAKYSFLAMTNFNYLAGKNGEVKEHIQTDDGAYLFHYYNTELKKDVMLLQTAGAIVHKNLDLGCNEVEILDGFGNKVTTLRSDNGIYGFSLTNEPIWVVGNIKKFEVTDNNAAVRFESLKKETVAGDILSFTLLKDIDKNLKVEIEGVEVLQNNGFSGNRADIKVNIPADASGEISFNVRATDDAGNVYFISDYILQIIDTVDLKIESELSNNISFNRWRIRATVTNMCETKSISGSFRVTNPEHLVSDSSKRVFKDIKPGKSRTYLISLPERVTKNAIDLKTEVLLDSGFKKTLDETLCFSASYYADKKPVIDGVMSYGEWNSSWFGADEKIDVKEIPDWNGAEDVSFSGTSMWDEENFYFVGVSTDDVHYTDHTPTGASNLWRGDSFQLGFDDRDILTAGTEGAFTELGLAYVPGQGDIIYRFSALYDKPTGLVENCEIKIQRYDGYTIYECKIPWTEIFKDEYTFDYDSPFRFSALVNDNDGTGRGWIEYMGGIGNPKSVSLFGDMTFVK